MTTPLIEALLALAGYALAVGDMGEPVDGLVAVSLHEDGSYDHVPAPPEVTGFAAVLGAWAAQRRPEAALRELRRAA